MRERRSEKSARARAVVARLADTFPQARIALRYRDAYELMVAVVLSAQCTDQRVNEVTPPLFARFPTVAALAGAPREELEALIRPCGLFRAKARALTEASALLLQRHEGRVPTSRAELAALPGLGNKSAGVVAMHLSGEPALPVDTHVARLAGRLDLSRERDPDRIERDLRALLPPGLWAQAHHLLIWHGRRICLARQPRCAECPVADLCPKRGVAAPRPRGGTRRGRAAD